MAYVMLVIAIIFEVLGTSLLKSTEQFTKLLPSLGVIVSYAIAFYSLSWTLNYIEVGVAYALWAGIGVVLVAIIGVVVFGETADLPGIVGITFIVAGVVILNLFSDTAVH